MTADFRPRAVLLPGPTGCGKSAFAAALADCIGGEIISVDSCAIYRGMDIGAAKPTPAMRRQIRHHLLDIRNPDENYSVGEFCRDAAALCGEITVRKKMPILCGGTMMYFHSLRSGLHDLSPASLALREKIDGEILQRGLAAMHAELQSVDSASAKRIRPFDRQRIQRALEVFRATGKPLSSFLSAQKKPPILKMITVALVPADRIQLRESIANRLDKMLADGFVNEVKNLIQTFELKENSKSLKMVGYRQAASHLQGECNEVEMKKRIFIATCQLAKRQMTWLRAMHSSSDSPLFRLDPFNDDALPSAEKLIRQFMAD